MQVDKENPIKQTRLKYILCHLFIKEKYLWVAKVCESLGLGVHFKVTLESICSEMFSISGIQNHL